MNDAIYTVEDTRILATVKATPVALVFMVSDPETGVFFQNVDGHGSFMLGLPTEDDEEHGWAKWQFADGSVTIRKVTPEAYESLREIYEDLPEVKTEDEREQALHNAFFRYIE